MSGVRNDGSTEQAGAQGPGRKSGSKAAAAGGAVRTVRSAVASAVWVVAVLAAAVLAGGALVVTLNFNPDNSVVSFLTETAARVNVLGDLKTFEPDGNGADAQLSARTKTVLVNWGICAVFYLVLGKVAERVVRP